MREKTSLTNGDRAAVMAEAAMAMIACAPVQFQIFPVLDPSTELVVCTPYNDIAEYQGTRATLEAEGVIPVGTDWPEGFSYLRWEDGRFRYWLRRERPKGRKGPRRQFLTVDWWMFRCDPLETGSIDAHNVRRKAKELADAIHRASAKGQAEITAHYHRYFKALDDMPFQAFKAACGIVEKQRASPCKSSGLAHGAES